MNDWTPEEEEAFNEIEKQSNLGKQILREIKPQFNWIELSDKDMKDLYFKYPLALTFQGFKLFIKDIEAKIKDKNNAS